jgi:hypothetical protein
MDDYDEDAPELVPFGEVLRQRMIELADGDEGRIAWINRQALRSA